MSVNAQLRMVLLAGLEELAGLRRRYGAHADFDLVERHQLALLRQLEALEREIEKLTACHEIDLAAWIDRRVA